jgi:hypothetical protein
MIEDQDRARRIVKLAASRVKLSQPKNWLLDDEIGSWEKAALDLLPIAASCNARFHLGRTEEQIDSEIADELALAALKACVNNARREEQHGICAGKRRVASPAGTSSQRKKERDK